jgi:hypothetical protein
MFLSLKPIPSAAEMGRREQSSRRKEAKTAQGGAQRSPGRAFFKPLRFLGTARAATGIYLL